MADVLTTAQIADLLGISPASLRTYKSKFKNELTEGIDFIPTDSGNLWTEQGETTLRRLLGKEPAPIDTPVNAGIDIPVNQSIDIPVNQSIDIPINNSQSEDMTWIDQALAPAADEAAISLIRKRFPVLVNQSLRRILGNPSEADRVELQRALTSCIQGLSSVNFALAMGDSFSQAIASAKQTTQAMQQLEGVGND